MSPRINIRCNVPLAAYVQIIRPPLHHLLACIEMFSTVDICCSDAVAFLMTHLPLHGIPRPEFRFHQRATGHRAEAMPTDVDFSIVSHQTKRPVDGIFTHWFIRVMVAGEHQFQMAGDFIYLLQNGDSLTRKRHNMRGAHFCATTRETDFLYRFPCGGNGPDFVSEINLAPAGEAQFTGTDKQMQRQRYRQPRKLPSLLIVANALKQFGQPLQRQGRIMIFNRRRGDAFQMQGRIVFSQSLLHGVAHDVAELLPGTGRDFQKAFILDNFQ
ncbi:hypothetical protein GHR52_08055 [Salmonella enterica subsp. enterica serovar Kentucky]|nr:hypothetical protein [Salmonella enterica subsp. enterica serovar Kentucky]